MKIAEKEVSLIRKYNVPGPRYTSYPTVPYWENDSVNEAIWKEKVKDRFRLINKKEGLAVYIHLPYCESLCTYCGCNTRITVNHAVEVPYIQSVLKEWEMYLALFDEKPRISELHLGGGTPTFFAPENLKVLMDGLFEKAELIENPALSFEAHPLNTTDEHLKVLYDLGFRRLSLGVQDFDPVVQDIINRKQSLEDVTYVTRRAREIGYTSVNYDLVYGLPMQKKPTVEDTISHVLELKPDRIAFYSYAHVPWIKPGQRKFTEKDLPTNDEKRELYELGKDMFIAAGYVEIGMDHFALPTDSLYKASEKGHLHRNFMGYTDNPTSMMIGLGVSSISDSYTAFAQNVKTVEGYYQKIEKGRIPIFRGHALSRKDLEIRKRIQELMCNFETSLVCEDVEVAKVLQEATKRLQEMEKDGLVVQSNCWVFVTEKGKPFIRNICMAFDERLWNNKPETEIFSQTI